MYVLSKTLVVNSTIAADTVVHVDHKWHLVVLSKQPLTFIIPHFYGQAFE